MNITKQNRKDLEIGDTCLLRVTVEAKEEGSWVQFRTTGNSPAFVLADFEDATFYTISPENVTKNTETAPKPDPNRKLRKGDKVQIVRDFRGRVPDLNKHAYFKHGIVYTVAADEWDDGSVRLRKDNGYIEFFHFWELELVTPREELPPFYIELNIDEWRLYKNEGENGSKLIASFYEEYPHAKEAAEAECARLNAECRKELQ